MLLDDCLYDEAINNDDKLEKDIINENSTKNIGNENKNNNLNQILNINEIAYENNTKNQIIN